MNFTDATPVQIQNTVAEALKAFRSYRKVSSGRKAEFLLAIAEEMELAKTSIVSAAMDETHLPEPRIAGEFSRTTGQLRMFAALVKEGSWVDARIDTAIPDRAPAPKPDLRKMSVPLGPVVVFGASNFPLAYSTAGGDTASALAAGCPVIVKAHPAHEHTSSLVAGCVERAIQRSGMPSGVFGHLYGKSFEVGRALVLHPHVKAVGFTGSYMGGKALFDLANKRDEPIPVFSEMGSVNPVFILPGALKERPEEIAAQYAASITLSVGQFCTNPGLLLSVECDALQQFQSKLGSLISAQAPGTMLHPGIASSYSAKREEALRQKGVELLAAAVEGTSEQGQPTLATVAIGEFIGNPRLAEEVFGPYSLLVRGSNVGELRNALGQLQGQLTISIIGNEEDFRQYSDFIEEVHEKAGRVIINGVPTGVEVCPSMHHGGPFPATTDSRFSSVGTDAIRRFVRPVCFQNFPQSLLPSELRDGNPMGIWRLVNSQWSKE